MPLVSVITPVRTDKIRLRYLKAAFQFLARQTITDWEWVIVLDGDDQHAARLRTLLPDGRVRIVSTTERVGAGSARNVGLVHATGKYVTMLDEGDLLPKKSLSSRVQVLEESPSTVWVAAQVSRFDSSKTPTQAFLNSCEVLPQSLPAGRYAPGNVTQYWQYPDEDFLVHPVSVMATRQSILSMGGWATSSQQESLILTASVLSAFSGTVVDEVVYHSRQRADQCDTSSLSVIHELTVRKLAWARMRFVAELAAGNRRILR
jgi:glycosyltransferase involved in cell wall biosynthesis